MHVRHPISLLTGGIGGHPAGRDPLLVDIQACAVGKDHIHDAPPKLQEYQETLGITGVVMEMNYGGGIPSNRVINSMRLLTEKVAPQFKS